MICIMFAIENYALSEDLRCLVPHTVESKTVRLLRGIRIAASKGEIRPNNARVTPRIL